MNDALKEELVKKFRSYLDGSPDLHQAKMKVDLYSLYSELTGLKNEVRIESRQLKSALDDFRAAFSSLDGVQQEFVGRFEKIQDEKMEVAKDALRPLISGLLDLYDRIAASGHSPGESRGFFSFICRRDRELLRVQAEGQQMILRRLVDLLSQCNVQVINVEQNIFDPRIMKAVGTDYQTGRPDGIVVGVQRQGFVWHGEVFRAAEVIVNKTKEYRTDE